MPDEEILVIDISIGGADPIESNKVADSAPVTVPESDKIDPDNVLAVRSILPFALVGILIVLVALVAMQWPSAPDPDLPMVTGTHIARVTNRITANGIGGAVVDLSVYVVLFLGLILIAMAFFRKERGALTGLIVVGALGIAYVGSMVLYVGGMVSICGFSLILVTGVVALLVAR